MIDYQIISDINVNIKKSRTRSIWPLDLQLNMHVGTYSLFLTRNLLAYDQS